MKRLVKSRQTGIFCTQCDKSIPVNTSRIIDCGMHSHYECLNKLKLKGNIMYMNKPDHKPGDERGILIAIDVDGVAEFISGQYYFDEGDYYTNDGELIEMSDMIAWDEKPTIEFL